MDTLTIALQITLIGMGLVFGAIVLLWGLMALLVRLTDAPAEPSPQADAAAEHELKQRAAAIAVAAALAQQPRRNIHAFPLPPTAIVSAWQAVMRADQLRKKG